MSCLGITGEMCESKQLEWSIAAFFSLSTKRDDFYRSPSFVFNNASLHLRIFPEGYKKSKPGFISVYLVNESMCQLNMTVTIDIKKSDGKLTGGGSSDVSIYFSMGYLNFYDRSNLERHKSSLVPSGILTIVCILKLNQDGKQATVKGDILQEKQVDETSDYRSLTELSILSENLRGLSANKDSCDVVLQVGDKEFKAHTAILMARSSVFAAMFKHDTLEKQTGIIKIPDCDSESFQEFLDYLYCGKLENVSFCSAFHLYCTSNKYDIQKLKEFCIEFLIESLAVDNLCDIIKLADKYDETKLITETHTFFNENWKKIFSTTEWESLMKNNYRLANKMLVDLSKN